METLIAVCVAAAVTCLLWPRANKCMLNDCWDATSSVLSAAYKTATTPKTPEPQKAPSAPESVKA